MDKKSRAAEFIDALRQLETSGELEPIVAMFDPAAEIGNPLTTEPLRGQGGVREFWASYRRTLGQIRSEFRHIIESDSAAALEWTSHGNAPGGGVLVYSGVSMLEFVDDKIRRFHAYFDPRALGRELEQPAEISQAPGRSHVP